MAIIRIVVLLLLVASVAYGQATTVPPNTPTILVDRDIPNDTPATRSYAQIQVNVAQHTDPATCIDAVFEVWSPSKTSWLSLGGFKRCGSKEPAKDKQPLIRSVFGPLPQESDRRLRVIVTSNQSVMLSATATTSQSPN